MSASNRRIGVVFCAASIGFYRFFHVLVHLRESACLIMSFRGCFNFIEWEIVDRIALFIDAVNILVAKPPGQAEGDLRAFIRISC